MRNIEDRIDITRRCKICHSVMIEDGGSDCCGECFVEVVKGGQGKDSGDVVGTYAILIGIFVIGAVGGVVGAAIALLMGGK